MEKMDRYQHQKTRRVALNPCHRPTHADLQNLLNILQKMSDSHGYVAFRQRRKASSVKRETTSPAAPSNPRGALNMKVNYDQKEVPIFKTYEEFHKTVLWEDIVGKTLLNILLNEEKEEIAQKIILNPTLAKSVGSLIEFCCYIRKRNAGLFTQRDSYEYVKFVLYLQDSYDESFVIFGNYGHGSRNIWSSTPRLLREEQYYLVGTISILHPRAESKQPAAIQGPVIVIDSDDDNNTQCQR